MISTLLVRAALLAGLLLVGNVVQQCNATSPSELFYYLTVRGFMAQACRSGSSSDVIERWCPVDETIRSKIGSGELSGHPDFQLRGYLNYTDLFPNVNGECGSYNGMYATYGRKFPVTYTGAPPEATVTGMETGPVRIRPAVLSDLVFDSAGIPKMQYCNGEEGYSCDFDRPNQRSIYNEESFSTWYKDSPKYNIRAAYKAKLYRVKEKYQFDSNNASQDLLTPSLFSPFTDHNLTGWPLSNEELDLSIAGGTGLRKFWFTSELHSSFQYNGGESFLFSGNDDVHVFVNNRLTLNLGGFHNSVSQGVNLSTYEQELGLVKGQVYPFDLFHAHRQGSDSDFKFETTLLAGCNVVSIDLRSAGLNVSKTIDWRVGFETQNSDWTTIGGNNYPIFESSKTILLMPSGIPNVVSYMFHNMQQHLGSGFTMSFKFHAQGNGHGFAVLLHNRELGLRDLNGGVGVDLGINGIENSLAIVFDMCPSFPSCSNSTTSLEMHYKVTGDRKNSLTEATRIVYDSNIQQNWRDGEAHEVTILYYANPSWIEVYVDDSLRLSQRDFSLSTVLGSSDAFVGFVSSSSNQGSSMNLSISEVQMKTMNAFALNTLFAETSEIFPKLFVANGSDSVDFTIQTYDRCQRTVNFGGSSSMVHGKLVASSHAENDRRLSELEVEPEVIDHHSGAYTLRFRSTMVGNFTVFMAFGADCSWTGNGYSSIGDCWSDTHSFAATSIPPNAPQELDSAAIAGIATSLVILVLCVSLLTYIVARDRRKRRMKLREDSSVHGEPIVRRSFRSSHNSGKRTSVESQVSSQVVVVHQTENQMSAINPVFDSLRESFSRPSMQTVQQGKEGGGMV